MNYGNVIFLIKVLEIFLCKNRKLIMGNVLLYYWCALYYNCLFLMRLSNLVDQSDFSISSKQYPPPRQLHVITYFIYLGLGIASDPTKPIRLIKGRRQTWDLDVVATLGTHLYIQNIQSIQNIRKKKQYQNIQNY